MASAVVVFSSIFHGNARRSSYRAVAAFIAENVPVNTPLVATGYAYLELINAVPRERVVAFPREQADHPGWVRRAPQADLDRDVSTLPERFVWTGVNGGPELVTLGKRYNMRIIAVDGSVIATTAERKAPTP
jgi:hypothetical protein